VAAVDERDVAEYDDDAIGVDMDESMAVRSEITDSSISLAHFALHV
jgi:hypothetical protein